MSEFGCDSGIYLSASEIIGDGPLAVGDVGYPVITTYIRDAEEVQTVDAEPEVLEASPVSDGAVAHADVGTFISRSSELLLLQASVWGTEG